MISDQMRNAIKYYEKSFPSQWISILETLDEKIRKHDPDYQILQIKEKFGTLRIYVKISEDTSSYGREIIQSLIEEAEDESKQYRRIT